MHLTTLSINADSSNVNKTRNRFIIYFSVPYYGAIGFSLIKS